MQVMHGKICVSWGCKPVRTGAKASPRGFSTKIRCLPLENSFQAVGDQVGAIRGRIASVEPETFPATWSSEEGKALSSVGFTNGRSLRRQGGELGAYPWEEYVQSRVVLTLE